MAKPEKSDSFLTIQVYRDVLNPRAFRVPQSWFTRASILAWILVLTTLGSSLYAFRQYTLGKTSQTSLIGELENEIQQLKVALENQQGSAGTVTTPLSGGQKTDPLATDDRPAPGPGVAIEGKEGVWGGLAEGVTVPPSAASVPIEIQDARIEWKGNQLTYSGGILFKNPGSGSQQGHIVILARGRDLVWSYPEGVLNVSSGDALFQPMRGEYFSVSRFRPIKAKFGPVPTTGSLSEVQVFLFDLNNKLILLQSFNLKK